MATKSNNNFNLDPMLHAYNKTISNFDSAAHLLYSSANAFPPVNVVKTDEYNFIIELAVAGFKKEEIDISAEKNSLRVVGEKTDLDARTYLTRGIAGRKFSRQFVLSDSIVVKGANLEDGILSINVENVIPETQKQRKIAIK